jgi:hypothetical protein
MGARGDSVAAIEPLLAAVAESGRVAASSGAMEEVLVHTEGRLEKILWGAEDEVARIETERERHHFATAVEPRRQIYLMREALVQRASALAHSFRLVLAMLDDIDRLLKANTGISPSDGAGTR